MDGLEAVELKLSEVLEDNNNFRFDSEYFKKDYLYEDQYRKHFPNHFLGEISFITDGQHGYHEVDECSSISHITAKNAKQWFADTVSCDKLAKWVDDKNKRSSLQEQDIILSTRGSVGYCAIVKKEVLPANIDQDIARIQINNFDYIKPEFLLVYMNSRFGQDWFLRNSTGMVQQGLSLARVRQMPIPVLTSEFQTFISTIIETSYQKLEESKKLYSEAEELLLEELGLNDFTPSNECVAVKSFSESFGMSGRLDAEYYQLKYDEIITKIKSYKYGFDTLASKFTIINGNTPKEYVSDAIKIIKTKNVRIPLVDIESIEDCVQESSNLTQEKDLLFASMGVGSLGRISYVTEESSKFAIDSTLKIFRNKTKLDIEIPTMLFLTSKIGQELIYKYVIGSTGIISINSDNINKLLVPNIDQHICLKITELVNQSIQLKEESKRLLEEAKTAVERAIEHGESAIQRKA